MRIFKEYNFEAAHWLPNVPEGHQCGRMHGHSYRVVIQVEGDVDPRTGFVIDFADISKVMKPVINELDHSTLNDLIPNPTAEKLALWIARTVFIPGLASVEVWETATAGVVYDVPRNT